jgi:precorrin-2 dehydrogenase / sirohydrochlorin ferrochelatase
MTKISDKYEWQEMCEFTEEDMENLLLFYPKNEAPGIEELTAMRCDQDAGRTDIFDGSFGFSVGA